jgi:hypothetical protein
LSGLVDSGEDNLMWFAWTGPKHFGHRCLRRNSDEYARSAGIKYSLQITMKKTLIPTVLAYTPKEECLETHLA